MTDTEFHGNYIDMDVDDTALSMSNNVFSSFTLQSVVVENGNLQDTGS